MKINEQFRTWCKSRIYWSHIQRHLQNESIGWKFHMAFVWNEIILSCVLTSECETRHHYNKLRQNITNEDILTQRLVGFCWDCQWLFHPNFLHCHPWCARLQGKDMGSDAKLEHLIRKNQLVIKCWFPVSKLESIILQAQIWVGALYHIKTADNSSFSVYFLVSYPFTLRSFIH